MISSAVLDANVLYSAPLRDFLLWLARHEAFFPYWSGRIQDEWMENLLQNRPELERERLIRTCREMHSHFPNAFVQVPDYTISTLHLPNEKDKHVLAAAIQVKSEYIVTFNLKDFPNTILKSYNVEAVSPDEFALRLIRTIPNTVLISVRSNRMNLKNPPKTVEQYLATLEEQKLHNTVSFLREHKDKI